MSSPEQQPAMSSEALIETTPKPIHETEKDVSYLGVTLEKAESHDGNFVPKREHYADYISDEFTLELQKKIAISFLQGDPILVEGGTSIGKTTTVKKMCAELGWEVHYANLNGATDVQDLMGRYIPNPHKTKEGDPEYVFADGKVTSGLRQEEGKTKVIILDEYNASAPNILIRLHEVLDALERGESVTLSEDASEQVKVTKDKTKVIALINPPGKGYFGREPLDPAQLRRWVYQKEANQLPDTTFSFSTRSLFGMGNKTEEIAQDSYTKSREDVLSVEQLQEIPGIEDVLARYEEFHKATKELIGKRKIAADQPQLFTYDDRMEPRRVRNFVTRFYNGDINETFQEALRYYYKNKLESDEDKAKLEELISHVAYTPKVESKRKGAERKPEDAEKKEEPIRLGRKINTPELREPSEEEVSLADAEKIMTKENFFGPDAIFKTFGVKFEKTPSIPFSTEELKEAFDRGEMLVLRAHETKDGLPLSMENMYQILSKKWDKENKGGVFNTADGWRQFIPEMYSRESPRPGWALVSKELLDGSTDKNYLEQTEFLIEYLKSEVFGDMDMPAEYVEAIAEFKSEKDRIATMMEVDWKGAGRMLVELKINQLARQSVPEAMYDLLLHHDNNPKARRLLESNYTWTNSRSPGGGLVGVGRFDAGGVGGGRWDPASRRGGIGVLSSRR